MCNSINPSQGAGAPLAMPETPQCSASQPLDLEKLLQLAELLGLVPNNLANGAGSGQPSGNSAAGGLPPEIKELLANFLGAGGNGAGQNPMALLGMASSGSPSPMLN